MRAVEKLTIKLRDLLGDIPVSLRIERTRAGHWQKESGHLVWRLMGRGPNDTEERFICGSKFGVKYLNRFVRLVRFTNQDGQIEIAPDPVLLAEAVEEQRSRGPRQLRSTFGGTGQYGTPNYVMEWTSGTDTTNLTTGTTTAVSVGGTGGHLFGQGLPQQEPSHPDDGTRPSPPDNPTVDDGSGVPAPTDPGYRLQTADEDPRTRAYREVDEVAQRVVDRMLGNIRAPLTEALRQEENPVEARIAGIGRNTLAQISRRGQDGVDVIVDRIFELMARRFTQDLPAARDEAADREQHTRESEEVLDSGPNMTPNQYAAFMRATDLPNRGATEPSDDWDDVRARFDGDTDSQ